MNAGLSHESLTQLLPWFLKGNLPADEHGAVEEHLKTCDACRQELDWLRELNTNISTLDQDVSLPNIERSLAAVLASVETLDKPRMHAGRSPLTEFFHAIWNPSAPFARAVFVGQFAAILALAIFLLVPHGSNPTFTTLSGPQTAGGGARLTLNFAGTTTVEQMNTILADVHGHIIAGPSASGVYIVELPIPNDKNAGVQAVIEKLKTSSAVRFVERQP